MKCKAVSCSKEARAKGWCFKHYRCAQKYGDDLTMIHVSGRDLYKYNFNESKYVGKTFAYLTIINFTRIDKNKKGHITTRHCLCECKCAINFLIDRKRSMKLGRPSICE